MEDERLLERVWKLLREDYGITTMEAFNEAYKKLPALDITVFWALPEEEYEDVRKRYDEKHYS